jgi:hypothetical protein
LIPCNRHFPHRIFYKVDRKGPWLKRLHSSCETVRDNAYERHLAKSPQHRYMKQDGPGLETLRL